MKPTLTTIERWNAPTSRFFQPIQAIGGWTAALSVALVGLIASLNTSGIPVPEFVGQINVILGVIGGAMGTLSKLTVDFDKVDWKGIAQARIEKEREEMGYYKH